MKTIATLLCASLLLFGFCGCDRADLIAAAQQQVTQAQTLVSTLRDERSQLSAQLQQARDALSLTRSSITTIGGDRAAEMVADLSALITRGEAGLHTADNKLAASEHILTSAQGALTTAESATSWTAVLGGIGRVALDYFVPGAGVIAVGVAGVAERNRRRSVGVAERNRRRSVGVLKDLRHELHAANRDHSRTRVVLQEREGQVVAERALGDEFARSAETFLAYIPDDTRSHALGVVKSRQAANNIRTKIMDRLTIIPSGTPD